jgi:hypothetical protein
MHVEHAQVRSATKNQQSGRTASLRNTMASLAKPTLKAHSDAMMLCAGFVASPGTTSLARTHISLKSPSE